MNFPDFTIYVESFIFNSYIFILDSALNAKYIFVLTGYPPRAGYPPGQGTPQPGYPPSQGTPPARVPTWPGYPLDRVPPSQGTPPAGPGRVPPPQLAQCILGNVAKHYGIRVPPPPRCGQTNKVKVLPSRRTTYAGNKICSNFDRFESSHYFWLYP